MTIQKISTELNSLNIVSNSADTTTKLVSETIKETMVQDGDLTVLTTILEKIISKLDEITDKVNE
jgi:hypothetical protein|tara:strand:+ start:281 stop:475 length:195 start_codon:yes stop_codon:yes gene_type:complete